MISGLVISGTLAGSFFLALGTQKAILWMLLRAMRDWAARASGGSRLEGTTAIIYRDSAAGVEQGGRTGLVSSSVALCFLRALFLTPVIASAITSPL